VYMKDDNLVSIKSLNVFGKDARGITADFSLPRKQADFIFVQRNAGTVSGNAFHEGKNDGTNPKILFLVTGEIEFSYRESKKDVKYTEKVIGPSLIQVKPNVVHAVHALTDIIILDCNSLADIQQDRIKEDV
jgi:hypothetical protein